MKVFITGGTGFIGKYVVPCLLRDGHEIFLLIENGDTDSKNAFCDSSRIKFVEGVLGSIETWASELTLIKPDMALHLAWEGIPDFSTEQSAKNLCYSLKLFDALGRAGCKKLIVTGTCAEYGVLQGKMSEEIEVHPENNEGPYAHNFGNNLGVYKNSIHKLGLQIAKEHKMQLVWTRLFFVSGPGQRSGSLIPSLISKVANGEKPELKTPNAGNDFIYVGDVAEALAAIVRKSNSDRAVYNIGSGIITPVRYIANSIATLYGHGEWVSEVPANPTGFFADISKIQREIGWKPNVAIHEIIRRMAEPGS